ncbi:MAG: type II CRISPR RNA-guided endonuclease Cas9, partial [Streptococcaceae bacterium]|nr:type II CRISPR RNA-guided endonuclease Cas9 [Streptococcaceae bacterium]
MKVSIGLDIGISSVGFSVIELNSKKVLELGSHIFSSGSAEKNQERRSFRGTRRGIRRKRNRLADLEKLLKEVGLPTVPKVNAPVYELRVKGLKEELQPSELTSVLYHILKRRGISYDLKDVDEEDASAISNYGASIDTNRRLLTKGKTVGEIQLERFEQYNQVRGMIAGKENKTLLNVFPTSAFIEEGQRILTHQQKFYPFITQDWIEKIVALISRKREYFVGPGSEKSPTKYGLYRRDVNGKITKIGETLFEELIGEDKIGTKIANGVKQRRASASSLSAQIYNLLNDLNNLTVKTANPNVDENGKLTSESKEKIIHALMNNDKKNQLPMTQITKLFDAKVEDVKGWRIDKNEKPMLHSLKAYHNFRFALKELEVEANKLPKDFFDKVADIITMNPEKSEVRKQLDDSSKEDSFMSLFGNIEHLDEIKDLIIQKNKELLIDSKAQWHSFSYVTLNTLIPELIATSKEQMTILTEMGLMKPDNEKYKGLTQVPVREITDKILNPVVSKSVGEALKVYNALAKQYGNKNIEHLVLELPRDDNEQDAKRNIIKFQKEQETEKSASDQEFIDQANISFEVLKQQCKLQRKLAQKIRFWYQQEGNCPYCGKKI